MLKKYLAFFLGICVLLGLFVLPAVRDYGFDCGIRFLKHGNPLLLTAWDNGSGDYSIFEGLEYEMVRVEFHDGAFFQFTSLEEHKITFQVTVVQRLVERLFHRTMADVAVVIHNHPNAEAFSPADLDAYNQLKSIGFTGQFMLWHKGGLTTSE